MTSIQCIILIQKRVIRLIHGANRWDHTNNVYYSYRSQKFNYIVELKTILFMFDACHNVLTNDLQQLFIKSIPSYYACRTHKFMRGNVRTNMKAMSLGVKLWTSPNTMLVSIISKFISILHYFNLFLSNYILSKHRNTSISRQMNLCYVFGFVPSVT